MNYDPLTNLRLKIEKKKENQIGEAVSPEGHQGLRT